MFFRVINFETSGDAPDGEVIEVGWVDVFQGRISEPVSLLIKPTRPISIETMAVHHLRERDLAAGISRDEAFGQLQSLPSEAIDSGLFGDSVNACYVAHSAKFEQSWFPEATLPFICTYKAAVRLWPESPRHSNQVLRYFLGWLDLDPALAMPPHRAAPDAYVTANILLKILSATTPEKLIEWSSHPVLLPRVTFGIYRGAPWTEVDDGFLNWVAVRDFDEDVLYTVKHEMNRRRVESGLDPLPEEDECHGC